MSIPWMQEVWTQNMAEGKLFKPLMEEEYELNAVVVFVVVMCVASTSNERSECGMTDGRGI
jgi:hypothetical protein